MYLTSMQYLTNYISLGYGFSSFTNHGSGSTTMQNPLNNHLCADQLSLKYCNYNEKLGSCLEHIGKFYSYLDSSFDDKKIPTVPKLRYSRLIETNQSYLLVIHHTLSKDFQYGVPRKMRLLDSTTLIIVQLLLSRIYLQ